MTKVKFLEDHSGLGFVIGEIVEINDQYASTFAKLNIVEIIIEEIKVKKSTRENALGNLQNIENATLD